MTTTHREALIVGGGIIGATSAFRLAHAGWHVTIFDPSPGTGSTWAAAGMIAALAEVAPGEEENFHLQQGAAGAWLELIEQLDDVTGSRLELTQTGTLLLGFDASDRRLVAQFEDVATTYGTSPLRVSRGSSEALFHGVTSRIREGLLLQGDAWIDPDEAMSLLMAANEQLGVTIVKEEVTRATTSARHVVVTTACSTYRGDIGLLATGARALPGGVGERVANEVRPVRGMTVRVRGEDRSTLPTVRAYVRGRMFYMVSRPGGYCVLGASSDEKQELAVELGDLQRLLRDGLDIIPSLESAVMLETRQGLRPATKDLTPFFEVVDERWAWSSGHYRHGITLAPLASLETLAFSQGFL